MSTTVSGNRIFYWLTNLHHCPRHQLTDGRASNTAVTTKNKASLTGCPAREARLHTRTILETASLRCQEWYLGSP